MTNTIRLKAADIRTIRAESEKIARRWVFASRYVIELGERFNTDEELGSNINVLKISKDPTGEWNDTDLFTTREWTEIRNPIELTEDGRGIIDFYIYTRDRDGRGELVCNSQAEFDRDGLKAIHADMDQNLWVRK